METRTPDGVTLRFDEAGEGDPAIVFVHGWCCSRNTTNVSEDGAQAKRYPGLEVAAVDCAHFIQLEKPDETNALVERLIAQVAEGAPA